MTRPTPYQGKHRAPKPVRDFSWDLAPFDRWPQIRPYILPDPPTPKFLPPGELPATGWDEAQVPDVETTQDIPMPLGTLPVALMGPDPEPVQIDAWTGPLPVVAPKRTEKATFDWVTALAAFWLLGLFAFALFSIATSGGSA